MANETFDWVRERFAEVLELEPGDVTRESRFGDDLDADSIDLIEVVNSAERSLGVTIGEDELYDLETVGQLVDIIDRHRAAVEQ
ncbi:MAG TPA: acyl carrier protein [Acidimicrobiales bacterium]